VVAYHSAWTQGHKESPEDLNSPGTFFSKFASPWKSYGTTSSTTQIQEAIKFAHFLWKYDPTYQQAIHRVVGYFLTDLEFYDPTYEGNLKDEDIRNYRELLEDQLNLKETLKQVLLNYCVYGNVVVAMLPPLRRVLLCRSCRQTHPIDVVTSPLNRKQFNFKYHTAKVQFEATCASCGNRGFWSVQDYKGDFRRNARISIYDLRHFTIQCDPFTDRRMYTWQIPQWIKQNLERNDGLTLSSTPMSVLEAIGENKLYTFNSEVILHLREPDLVGLQTGGWGIPQALYCYGASRYTFGLRKMNEVLAADYMIPIRLMSPAKERMSNPSVGIGPVTVTFAKIDAKRMRTLLAVV
jgi:hypothetical protein